MSHNNIIAHAHIMQCSRSCSAMTSWTSLNGVYENNDKKHNILFFLGFTLGNIHVSIQCWIYPFLLILFVFYPFFKY